MAACPTLPWPADTCMLVPQPTALLRRADVKCVAAAAVVGCRAIQQLSQPTHAAIGARCALTCADSQACLFSHLYRHGIAPLLRLLGGPELLAAAALVSRAGRISLGACAPCMRRACSTRTWGYPSMMSGTFERAPWHCAMGGRR